MSDEDKDKTAFTSHLGTYRYTRMPFGLKNGPATFQRALDIILSGVKWQICLVYIDDVIVFSKDRESHLRHLDEVLTLLREAGVTIKLSKCFFFEDKVDYLGHVISPGRLSVAAKNKDAIRDAVFPRTLTQVRSFLGACNVYRRFVKGFARIAKPLNDMLRKDATNDFDNPTEEQLEAFETLKKALVTPPILALPKVDRPYVIETDASEYQIGCTLLQEQDDGLPHPVGYWSRSLTQAERNYSTTERECLSVVWAVTSLRPYIENTKFTVRTDHDCLRWLMNLTESTGRLTRWRLRLSEFEFVIEYKPGKKNQVADALSRLIRPRGADEPIDDVVPVFVTTRQTFLAVTTRRGAKQRKPTTKAKSRKSKTKSATKPDQQQVVQNDSDVEIKVLDDELIEDDLDEMEPDAWDVHRAAQYDAEMIGSSNNWSVDDLPSPLTVDEILEEQKSDTFCQNVISKSSSKRRSSFFEDPDDGLLKRRCPYDGQVQIVLPETLRPRVLSLSHHSLLAGHPGQTRLYNTLRRTYYWPHMAADAFATVRNCQRCARNRIKLRKKTNFLKLFPATKPLDSLAMDILGPLPKTKKGNEYLLVICCRFSKLTQVIPLRTISSYNLAVAFCSHWVFKYGTPRHMTLDNAQYFTSKFFQAVCRHLGVSNKYVTTYHPQSNGQVERFNRTIAAMLRNYVNDHQDDWDKYAETLTYAYNNHVHRSTKTTPFELVLSRPPPEFSLDHRLNPRQKPDAVKKADFINRMDDAIQKAYASLRSTQTKYKKDYDRSVKTSNATIKAGDWVLLDNPEAQPKKLEDHTQGPFEFSVTTFTHSRLTDTAY